MSAEAEIKSVPDGLFSIGRLATRKVGVSMTLEQRARQAHKELFARYDQLNALWLKAEAQLTEFHVPRPADFTYAKDEDPESPVWHYACLGLQKIKGKWRICHTTYRDFPCADRPQEWDGWTPITECSAQIRMRAARHFAGFRREVVESAEKFIPQIDEAIDTLAKSLGQDSNIADLLAERAKLNGRAP